MLLSCHPKLASRSCQGWTNGPLTPSEFASELDLLPKSGAGLLVADRGAVPPANPRSMSAQILA